MTTPFHTDLDIMHVCRDLVAEQGIGALTRANVARVLQKRATDAGLPPTAGDNLRPSRIMRTVRDEIAAATTITADATYDTELLLPPELAACLNRHVETVRTLLAKSMRDARRAADSETSLRVANVQLECSAAREQYERELVVARVEADDLATELDSVAASLRESQEHVARITEAAAGEREANKTLYGVLNAQLDAMTSDRAIALEGRDQALSRALEAEESLRHAREQFALLERERDALRQTVADFTQRFDRVGGPANRS